MRDVREGPDGLLYLVLETAGRVVRQALTALLTGLAAPALTTSPALDTVVLHGRALCALADAGAPERRDPQPRR